MIESWSSVKTLSRHKCLSAELKEKPAPTLVLFGRDWTLIWKHFHASVLATAVARGIMFSACLSICSILVHTISQERLMEFLHIWQLRPLKDEPIRFS